MAARQGVRRAILVAWLDLNRELVAKEIAHPGVLRNRRETLVRKVFKAEMVNPHDEWPRPEVGPPIPHHLDQVDELPFVHCKLGMVWGDGAAEE
jgi:hypothetical protein